ALVSFAMGAQSVIAAKAGLPGISTTYVTGTLVTAVVRGFSADSGPQQHTEARRDAAAWCAYLSGAVIGTLLYIAGHGLALWIAAVFVAACAVWFRIRQTPRRDAVRGG